MSQEVKPCPGLPGEDGCPNSNPRPAWQGYCNPCHRRYHRKRYRARRAAEGQTVYGKDERLADNRLDAGKAAAWEEPSDAELAALVVPPTPVERMEPPIHKVTYEEWESSHGSQILHHDIRANNTTGDEYVPTEEWEDGEYKPLRLGPPPED